jgi:uncharacterized protein (UPF0548 family)
VSAWPRVLIGAVDERRLAEVTAATAGTEPTAAPRGLLDGPAAADQFERRRVLGRSPEAFEQARAALRSLAPQRSISAVSPIDVEAALDATIVAALRIGPLHLLAIDQIVALVDEPDRYGFAYVTLPGHVLCGEEAFLIERTREGEVVASVRGWADLAVPGGRLLRAPLRLAERVAADRYLEALARAAQP